MRTPQGNDWLGIKKSANGPRLLLDAREAARMLSVCERTLQTLVKRGELQVVRIGRRCVRYPVSVLEAWIARHTAADL